MWTIDEFQFNDALKKTVAPKVLIDAVSQLYQLPINGHTELRPWVQAVITHHVPLLAKCVIVS